MNRRWMPKDPVTGPLSREEFAQAVAAPFGEATGIIRQYDPLWGRAPGEKFEWEVRCSRKDRGVAYVTAADQKEADKLADDLSFDDVDWDDDDDFDILSVEPRQETRKRNR